MVINIQDDILKLRAMGLLDDKTTKQNIIWATDTYSGYGAGYGCREAITAELIAGANANIIKTRARKAMEQQSERTQQHAEGFSPFWICEKMKSYQRGVGWEGLDRICGFPVAGDNLRRGALSSQPLRCGNRRSNSYPGENRSTTKNCGQ